MLKKKQKQKKTSVKSIGSWLCSECKKWLPTCNRKHNFQRNHKVCSNVEFYKWVITFF